MWTELSVYLAGFWTLPAVCIGFLAGTGNLRPLAQVLFRRRRPQPPVDMGSFTPSPDKIDLSQYTPDGPPAA